MFPSVGRAGLTGQDLENESIWRSARAEVNEDNLFYPFDSGDRRRSQTALALSAENSAPASRFVR